ncbi:hypothetical protein L3V83_08190 [Thiotrichales bacterium 19X7-9]|nr:hypothetical protein [Thiotrichales bacterium 19X7-9]
MKQIVYVPKHQNCITKERLKDIIDEYPKCKIHLRVPLVVNNIFTPCPTMPELYSKHIFAHRINSWKNYFESIDSYIKSKCDYKVQSVWSLHEFMIDLFEDSEIEKAFTDYKLYFTRFYLKYKDKNKKIMFM